MAQRIETRANGDQTQAQSTAKRASHGGDDKLGQSFAAALKAVSSSPGSEEAWDHVEELADTLQRPDEVAAAYKDVLELELERPVWTTLARRAARFFDEWFGDEPESLRGLLVRILELDADATWAFERLTVVLTAAERWDDLLDLYDRVLETTAEPGRRKRLLDDAAHLAKDFAQRPGRAVDYMLLHLDLDPSNDSLAAAIERLLARQNRFEDLIELWQSRLAELSTRQARDARLRIAKTFLDHLEAAGPALEELQMLLDEVPGQSAACEQLERILRWDEGWEDPSTAVRLQALALLRTNYEAADRASDLVAAVQTAITFTDGGEHLALLREAGARLAILGRDAEALEHYAALLALEPADTDARRQMRQLSRRSNLHQAYAEALVAAAHNADPGHKAVLLSEAGHQYRAELDAPEQAIDIYRQVVDLADADRGVALGAAHHLNELLAAAGRTAERLDVLERLAELEPASAVRRALQGEAGHLADDLGDPDRALAAYARRLDTDAEDLEALDATVEVLAKHERWEPLIEALRRRAEVVPHRAARRADLRRVAHIQTEQLEAIGDAIETWLQIRSEFGDEAETIEALDALLSQAMRWPELAQILDRASDRRRSQAAALLSRLGEVHHAQLDQASDAVQAWVRTLAVDPADARARAGLVVLCEDPSVTHEAAEALARAYRQTGELQALAGLADIRVAANREARACVEVLREAARLHELEFADLASAQAAIAQAFVLDPDDPALEAELLRLAEATSNWRAAVEAFAQAAEAAPSVARKVALRRVEGHLREEVLDDPAGAVVAYGHAVELDRADLPTQRAIIRASGLAGTWDAAAQAVVGVCKARELVDADALHGYVSAAEVRGDWDPMVEAMQNAIEQGGLSHPIARDLEAACATWHRDHRGDLEAARAAAARAVEHGPNHLESLKLLADIERKVPDARMGDRPALAQTLLRIDPLLDRDLDALAEAAELVVEGRAHPEWVRELVARLFRKAARLFSQQETVSGSRSAEVCVRWALDRLVELDTAASRPDDAIAILRAAAEMPWDRDRILDLKVRAARLYVQIGDRRHAIDLFRQVLEERADDLELVRELAQLCDQENRVLELVSMRGRELELTEDVDRRLELRLEMSRLVGEVEKIGGRVESLLANLEETPGHRPSVEALTEVMADKGRLRDLADILTAQAERLHQLGDHPRSAQLWMSVASLVEDQFGDVDRAIEALRKVIELDASEEALDTLARLHLQRQEPAEAARVLKQRLAKTEGAQRVAILLRLAKAQVQAGKETEAIDTLQTAFSEAPKAAEVRKLLIRLYREHEQWEPLAHTLTTATEHVSDPDTILTYAREASEIYRDRLGTPDQSVPVLERAHALAPDDRSLKAHLAEGLRVAGRLDEARDLLGELITAFGRRRSPQRAQAHLQLARVAHAQGDIAEALDQLERASNMDADNPAILKSLAEMAREAGEHDRSERAYRTLLMQVRRRPISAQDGPARERIGASEVLYELSRLAAERGDEEQAQELLESALEAVATHDDEGPNLQGVLEARGDTRLLERVIQTRLQQVDTPRKRAELLGDLAALQENGLQDMEAALASRLAAIKADPGSPLHHERARSLAGQLDRVDAYVDLVQGMLDKSRRASDIYARCELLLRMAEALAFERDQQEQAQQLIVQAEELGVREVDVWRTAARIAGHRGDTQTQVVYLERLAEVGEQENETRADALYRMAEVYLAAEDTLERGVDVLTEALEVDTKPERASRILQRATEIFTHEGLLALFERVARQTEDTRTVLVAIERRATHPDTDPEVVREGVKLALEQEQPERAEALMLRAVELGSNLLDAQRKVGWALIGLARRRSEVGDLAGAVKWLCEAIDGGESIDGVLEMASHIVAATSEEGGDLTLAVKVYEALLEHDGGNRAVWQPLAELYRKLGDHDRLHRLVEDTLDSLSDANERNALRLELAQTLLEQPGREDEAVDVLRNVLLESPENDDAQRILAQQLERSGREEELDELLNNQLMQAQQRGDAAAVVAGALRLGRRQATRDPESALSTLRGARDWAPNHAELLRALLELLQGEEHREERLELLEALVGVEQGEEAAKLAEQLAALHAQADDEEAELRALVLGYRRAPGHPALRARLEQAYESRGDYRGLAQMLISSAEQAEQSSDAVALLRQAAGIHRDLLGDPETAVSILERAHEAAPAQADLALELVSSLAAAGSFDRALSLVSRVLDQSDLPEQDRLHLLSTRADLRTSRGDLAGVVEDLEAALPFDGPGVTPRLLEALEAHRQALQGAEEAEGERPVLMRLVELSTATGNRQTARELLTDWAERERKDIEALRMLRDLDAADEQWEAVAKSCARLVAIETGDQQVSAALQLSHACKQMGRPADAKAGLEHARRKQPENREIRAELLEIYESLGANKELAKLLSAEAEETDDAQRKLELLRRVSELFLSLGDVEHAMPAIQQVLELAPGDPGATISLADAHLATGGVDEADQILDHAIAEAANRRSPELAALYQRKARVAAARGDAQGQLSLLQQAFTVDKSNGEIAAELADLAEILEVWDLAIRVLRTITLLDGPCPITRVQAFLRQAQICHRRGDRQRAVLWARKAKHEAPDEPEVAEFLASLGES